MLCLNGCISKYSRFFVKSPSTFSSTPKRRYCTIFQSDKIRNIGIIAHVDAGKTTTAERLLYLSGVVKNVGDVDKGDTTMDYLQLERERGITIQSAAISLPWKDIRINLIDTPGHVDFQAEVERSVRVLDGAVTILDAVNGVQAQTTSVWKQANRYNVPRITFLNKMDREGASHERSIESMITKLQANPVLIQVPIGNANNFTGVIDLIEMKIYEWPEMNSTKYIRKSLEKDYPFYNQAVEARNQMIEKLADVDDEIMEIFLENGYSVPDNKLFEAIKRATVDLKITPVFLGSSFRTKGIQPLLNGVISFLPSPDEKPPVVGHFLNASKDILIPHDVKGVNPLCALAFKVVHDKHRGLMTYLRVYSGVFKAGEKIFNTTRELEERGLNLFRIDADHLEPLTEIRAGDIGAVVGFKQTHTGDTIVSREKKGQFHSVQLDGVRISPPVFTCAIEPQSEKDIDPLKLALASIVLEDPSIRVTINEELGQTLISGMGELHMEIIADRILNHYKIQAKMGKMQISYRCSISNEGKKEHHYNFDFGGKKKYAGIVLEISPNNSGDGNSFEEVIPEESLAEVPSTELPAVKESIRSGVESALHSGPLFSFQVVDVHVKVTNCFYNPESSPASMKACVIQAIVNLIKECEPFVMQPIMSMELNVPNEYSGPVLSDLTNYRKGMITSVEPDINGKVVQAEVPLRHLIGYSTNLRSLSQGAATFSTEFLCYKELSYAENEVLMKELRGF